MKEKGFSVLFLVFTAKWASNKVLGSEVVLNLNEKTTMSRIRRIILPGRELLLNPLYILIVKILVISSRREHTLPSLKAVPTLRDRTVRMPGRDVGQLADRNRVGVSRTGHEGVTQTSLWEEGVEEASVVWVAAGLVRDQHSRVGSLGHMHVEDSDSKPILSVSGAHSQVCVRV